MSADSDSPVPPPGRVYEILTRGDILGEYTVESCLSYDIFGSLYRVVDTVAETKTLFVLPRILSDDEAFLRRFREFKEKQVRLTHPRILSLGESRDIGGRICFVAESVTGKSLSDHLGAAGVYPTFRNPRGVVRANPSEAARDFTPEKVRKVARQVLEALEAAHAQGVLHLNLTPGNMLLLDSGDIKVLGFGLYGSIGTQAIEMLVSAGIPPVSLGPRNVRLNTADIISPEVHLKQEPDVRSDLYAFGMSVYWLLTGLKPAANYRPPSGIVPALDPGWDVFLARCLTRERAKRYPNARTALRDLENLSLIAETGYADDIAKAVAGASRAQPAGRRKKWLAAVGAVVALGISSACTAILLESDVQPQSEDIVPKNSPMTRHSGDSGPSLTLRVTPGAARVDVMPGKAEFVVKDGLLELDAKPGPYTLLVTAPGFPPQRTVVKVTTGKGTARAIRLFKEGGTVELTTAPGALVTLSTKDGEETWLGLADTDGKLVAKAGVGIYTLRIEKKNFKPAFIAGVAIRNGEHFMQSLMPEGEPASLILTGTPAGAKVSIDGEDAGTTPLTLENRQPGKELTLVFTKENYRPVTRKVVPDAGERKTVDYGPMIASHGLFDFTVSLSGRTPKPDELAGLSIARSDDGLRPHDWADARKLPREIPVGSYLITVTHPDYEPFRSAFTINDGETTRLDINLNALPARFELTGIPENVPYDLNLNNRRYDTPPSEIPADVPIHLEIAARDYEPLVRDFTARPRQDFKIDVKLKKMGPPVSGNAFVIPYLNTRLVWIPAGETRLGGTSDEPGHTAVEEPATRAKFTKGFWVARTEVTQAEYESILDSNPSVFRGAQRPVENVTHADALRYCKALTSRELAAGRLPDGYEYRLPDELEWEYACRAGAETPFAFGSKATPADGNFVGSYPPAGPPLLPADGGTRPVGSYPANAYGLVDMHGNVREWMLEPYRNHLPGGRKTDYIPGRDDFDGNLFVARGGSWKTPATEARSAFRPTKGVDGSTIADDLGFRIVLGPSVRP